jgi:hypothetical protein
LVGDVLPLSAKECAWARRQIQAPYEKRVAAPEAYHLLRAHGLTGRLYHRDFRSGQDLLALLTDQQKSTKYYGRPTLERTRYGLRFPKFEVGPRLDDGTEMHRDQCLAALGELGVPLSLPLVVDGEPYTLREVLRDSLANFHLRQEELAWTGLAYALYLPPHREWSNRFHERFSFDDLAGALIAKPLQRESCGGTHLLFTLTVLYRADQERPVLSEPMRARVGDWLRKAAEATLRRQRTDGTWPQDWYRGTLQDAPGWAPDSTSGRLAITGHIAEWLLYLPPDMQPDQKTYRRAADWLYQELRKATPDQQWKLLCPYTHAACAVRELMCEARAGTGTR